MVLFRHITSAILLVLFATVQLLPSLVNFSIRSHHSVMHKNLGMQKKIVRLQFSVHEWTNVKRVKAHEIEIDGKLFDIRSVEIEGNIVWIKGCYDAKEDRLSALSRDLKKKGTDLEKNKAEIGPLFLEEIINYSFFKEHIEPVMYIPFSHTPFASFLQKDSPPPKV